jgi:hypothetical protein
VARLRNTAAFGRRCSLLYDRQNTVNQLGDAAAPMLAKRSVSMGWRGPTSTSIAIFITASEAYRRMIQRTSPTAPSAAPV